MVAKLGSPQPVFHLPPLAEIPDTDEDRPVTGISPGEVGPMRLPELLFGAAAFSDQYNTADHLSSFTPLRTVRLALRYGINAFDTSAYYGPSEIVLGTALKTLAPEFPRASYKLMTKCGRYGVTRAEHDYAPDTVRRSVLRSLERLGTDYLDTVYLHDVEFVCEAVQPRLAGKHLTALTTEKEEYGLAEGQEAKVWGSGDQAILDAFAELRKMKQAGLIKHIGITGYPLPTLLRLSLLVLHTAPYEPLDVLLNYSNLNLQNDTFAAFLPHFRNRAKIPQLLAASPLHMGLLTPSPPPWHPAPPELRAIAQDAIVQTVKDGWEAGLPNLALGYAYRRARELEVPTVVGLSQLREVHETIRVWRALKADSDAQAEARKVHEEKAFQRFDKFRNYSWASGL